MPGIALLLACLLSVPAAARVKAGDYQDFWLWGGAPRQTEILRHARSLYILQGELRPAVRASGETLLLAQGGGIPQDLDAEIWLVYRADTLHWPLLLQQRMVERLERWRRAGNRVVGIQIDFDTATRGLPGYVAALEEFRRTLPAAYRLGITGLLDWARNGDGAALSRLKKSVDEVVVQTYQGRQTIRNYAQYLDRLDRLPLPFKIGLVENGAWEEIPALRDSPWFRGYVVFLLKP